MADKKADLAGPGIGDYTELERVLPADYSSLLSPKETQKAIFELKNYIEANLCKELNLMMVTVPLIVDEETGVNDYLDRDGSRTPIQFHISNDRDKHPINAQVVQAATKWKRMALKQFNLQPGEGLCTCLLYTSLRRLFAISRGVDGSDQRVGRRNGYAVAFTSAHDGAADGIEFELPSRGKVFLHGTAYGRRQTVERLLQLREVDLRSIGLGHRAGLGDRRIEFSLPGRVSIKLALIFPRR